MILKSLKRRFLSTVLVTAIATTSITPVQLQAKENTKERNELQVNYQSTENHSNSRNYTEEGLEITFQISSQWKGAFNAEVIVHNIGNQPIENWALKFDLQHGITNIWNGEIHEHGKDYYII